MTKKMTYIYGSRNEEGKITIVSDSKEFAIANSKRFFGTAGQPLLGNEVSEDTNVVNSKNQVVGKVKDFASDFNTRIYPILSRDDLVVRFTLSRQHRDEFCKGTNTLGMLKDFLQQ